MSPSVASVGSLCDNLVLSMKENIEIDDFTFEYTTIDSVVKRAYSMPKASN